MGIYLGVDPSKKSTGYAIFNDNYELLTYGVIQEDESDTQSNYITLQYDTLNALIEEYKVTHIVCEDQYFGQNVDTLKKLTRAMTVSLLLAGQHGLDIQLKYPSSWRKIYHGTGKANKRATFKKVKEDFGFKDFKFTTHNDITDAIGIAWTCVHMAKEA